MIVFITGATAGIGKASAEIFAKNGYDLVITGRREERLKNLAKELTSTFKIKVHTLCFDVRNLNEVKTNVASLPADFKNIDILLNNAGLSAGLSTLQDGSTDDWDVMIDTNIKGLLYITRQISEGMIARKKGHIINMGSLAGKEVYPNGNVYCATKFAVDALSKAMRIDMLQHGIKVSSINPGMVETEFSIVRFHGDEKKAKQVYLGLQPLVAEDIAETIFWVASRPAHVNINDVVITPTAQANTTLSVRKQV
jgi:3-hydroxy acid dehydrogenase/malonic semialdehyde reductase